MIVADCSAVVDALTGAPGSHEVRTVLADGDLHAPTLLDYEVPSALRGLVRRDEISTTRAVEALADFDALPIRRWNSAPALRARVFAMRHTITAYDAAYVALAEALGCPLLTRDVRLARAAGAFAEVQVR
ncbi:type II toxin-antitoxin system VapC family toxin [Microbacterium luticocti]|uniref:type II toxin-antitoxin system VapC family toxin n=1 Tax=Microbacterium luticocti TaxID=451764 RepID=UPI0003FD2DA7|nr:type II toxin-antitoxin system VapC family toxin [Microbacterium luticocti]